MEPLEIYDAINNKHINIYVTKEVAEQCRADNAFAQDLFNKLQDQNIENGSAIEIATIKCEVSEEETQLQDTAHIEENSQQLADKETWSRRETLLLLKTYQKHKSKFKEHFQKKSVWSIIANELAEQQINKSPDKCAEKWKNLMRTYRAISEKPSTPTRFQYLEEMESIFSSTNVQAEFDSGDEPIEQKFNPESNSKDTHVEEKESWSKYETLLFLKHFQKLKSFKQGFSNEREFWAKISAELAKDNIYKLPDKCASKWKNLHRSYKRNIERPSLSLRFQYFQEVDDLMNDIEIQISDDLAPSGDVGFEKVLNSEEFKCFVEKSDQYAKPKDVTTWTYNETVALISAYKKNKKKFQNCPSRKYIWTIIACELLKSGIDKDIDKCENKWKSLMRSYKKGLESGEFPRFNFYEEIADCLQDSDNENDGEVTTTQDDTYEPMDQDSNDDKYALGKVLEKGNKHVSENGYEEIIIQTEPDQPENTVWSPSEISTLIKAYAKHRIETIDPKRKSDMWDAVSRELATHKIKKSAESCKKKWKGLYNIYKTHKLSKSGPVKFAFYKQIDDVLKTTREEENKVQQELDKSLSHNEKCRCIRQKMLEKQTRHIERMQMLKRKLDLEERKVEAFEFYVKQLKTSGDT